MAEIPVSINSSGGSLGISGILLRRAFLPMRKIFPGVLRPSVK
jgi:hypothetical protein